MVDPQQPISFKSLNNLSGDDCGVFLLTSFHPNSTYISVDQANHTINTAQDLYRAAKKQTLTKSLTRPWGSSYINKAVESNSDKERAKAAPGANLLP
jgi:hypothetical protein